MNKKITILMIGFVLLTGCSSSSQSEQSAFIPLDKYNELIVKTQNLENKLVILEQQVNNQQKQIQELQLFAQQFIYNQIQVEQQAYIKTARELMLRLINAKTVKTKKEFENIIHEIILESQKYLNEMSNINLNEYEEFKGEFSEEKLSLTPNNTILYEAKLTGSAYNKKEKKDEQGIFQIKLEFTRTENNQFKIVSSQMIPIQ